MTNHEGEHYSRVEGSCQWIDSRDDFQDWRDPAGQLVNDEVLVSGKNPSLFWVCANPGTGKTFLAAHVVDELRQFQLECASYFFHAGNKSSRSMSNFLRSMAYQMAMSNSFIREKLVGLCQEDSTFDKDDAAMIWTKIFRRGIFQVCRLKLGSILHLGTHFSRLASTQHSIGSLTLSMSAASIKNFSL